jgi:hypothetical protein
MSISIPALAPSSFIYGQSTQVWNTQQSTLKTPASKSLIGRRYASSRPYGQTGLGGRYVRVTWDMQDLCYKKDEIVVKGAFNTQFSWI